MIKDIGGFSKEVMDNYCFRQKTLAAIIIFLSFSIGIGLYFSLNKKVTIVYDGNTTTVSTVCSTFEEVLRKNGIEYSEHDYLSILPMNRLGKTNEIVIKTAVPIHLEIDSNNKTVMTYKDTVGEMLTQEGITLGEKDEIQGYSLSDEIVKDMSIKVIRTTEVIETVREQIPFQVVEKENWQLDKGIRRTIQPGKQGVKENQFKVTIKNGVEAAKQLIHSAVITSPINQIIEYGTAATYKTSRGEEVRYRKVLNMRATAYTASFKDTGKHPDHPEFGITYTGIRAKKGIIAVDPKVIPLGTKVYVEGVGDVPDYGYALAADIGSAIKGDLIDIYLDDQKTVDAWGCKKVRVYILLDE